MRSPILIWGAGAIGGSLGAAFLRAGHDVVFVDTAVDHIAAINTSGLKIVGPLVEDRVRAPAFTPATLEGCFDTVFLCVKAHHTREAAQALVSHLSVDGCVVSAQNGLNELTISEIVGKDRTVGCFVNFGADYLSPGEVHLSGHGSVVIGELDGEATARIQTLHKLMLTFSPKAILTDNIWGYLWGKMIYGALLFATALSNDSIADVLANPRHRAVLTKLGNEVGAVAKANGVTPEGFDGYDPGAFAPGASLDAQTKSFEDMVAHNRRSTKSHSGIWRDLAVRKRKTEVDALITPIVEIGTVRGLTMPIAARVVEMIHEIEAGARSLDDENLVELALGQPETAGG